VKNRRSTTGLLILFFASVHYISAQIVDTINADNFKLNVAALKEKKTSYAVYMTDTNHNRIGTALIWERKMRFTKDAKNNALYDFEWKFYMKDTLIAITNATGFLNSMKPISHKSNYFKRGKTSYVFENNVVTVPDADKKTKKDSAFYVMLNAPAFEFPMDLELYGLLPFKKIGQKFAVAFYEPGKSNADYYNLIVTGKENLEMPGGSFINCWELKIDYKLKGSFAVFWISDTTREVLKVEEDFPGGKSYKVRLY
jgi:hypothetical protein